MIIIKNYYVGNVYSSYYEMFSHPFDHPKKQNPLLTEVTEGFSTPGGT